MTLWLHVRTLDRKETTKETNGELNRSAPNTALAEDNTVKLLSNKQFVDLSAPPIGMPAMVFPRDRQCATGSPGTNNVRPGTPCIVKGSHLS